MTTQPSISTWAHPIKAYYNSSNAVHATISHSGSPSTGAMTVYCVYVQLA